MLAEYRKQTRKGNILEPFHFSVLGCTECCWTWIPRTVLEELPNQQSKKRIGDGAERDTQRPTCCRTADQRVNGWKNWGCGTVPNTLLKLLAKDKPLYSGKVREGGKWNFRGEGNEVTADGRQTGSWKLQGERLKTTADKDQPPRKVSSWNPRRKKQH